MTTHKFIARKRRKARIRAKVKGTEKRPRLVVFRSLNHIHAQVIDDENNKVIFGISDLKSKAKEKKIEKAKKVGEEIAKKAKDQKITSVVFDRNGYRYHGRIKALAEGAREGGLEF